MDTLPDELICLILNFCGPLTRFRFSNVSKRFRKYRKMISFKKNHIYQKRVYKLSEYYGIFYMLVCFEDRKCAVLGNRKLYFFKSFSHLYYFGGDQIFMALLILVKFFFREKYETYSKYIKDILDYKCKHISFSDTEIFLSYREPNSELVIICIGIDRKVKWKRYFRIGNKGTTGDEYLDKNGNYYLCRSNELSIASEKGVTHYTLPDFFMQGDHFMTVFKNFFYIVIHNYPFYENKIIKINLDTEDIEVFAYNGFRIQLFENGFAIVKNNYEKYTIIDLTSMKSIGKFKSESSKFPIINKDEFIFVISKDGTVNGYG